MYHDTNIEYAYTKEDVTVLKFQIVGILYVWYIIFIQILF